MLATFALVFAGGTLIWRIYQSQKQFKITFFIDYTKRYHGIFVNLPLDIMSDEFNIDALDSVQKDKYEVWIRAFFDLCSEEYHLSKKRLIDEDIWNLWEAGMNTSFKKPAMKSVWNKIKEHGYYDQDFISFVESKTD